MTACEMVRAHFNLARLPTSVRLDLSTDGCNVRLWAGYPEGDWLMTVWGSWDSEAEATAGLARLAQRWMVRS